MEVLAPGGNARSFVAAIKGGADAIYIGLESFSARKNAENFTIENLRYYISYAHLFSVKVHVCVNILVKEGELPTFFETVKAAYLLGADAFIVQDLFLGKLLKKAFPQIVLHLSTQAGVNNTLGATLAKDYGFSRVVLARECSLKQIEKISKIIETEVFVHGAMCSSFSGHCYFSSLIGGNSGNRGLCRQPCRKLYRYDDNKLSYALSLSDLCLAKRLDELKAVGVKSIKIEGRMRSPEYAFTTAKLYKKALASKDIGKEFKNALKTFNRGGFSEGYVFGQKENLLSTKLQSNRGLLVGKITILSKDTLTVNNTSFNSGDGFKIISNGNEVGNAICLQKGKALKFKGKVKNGDELYLTKDSSLSSLVENEQKLMEIEIFADFRKGFKAKLSCLGISVESDEPLLPAEKQPIDKETLYKNLLKTDIYPFLPKLKEFVGGDGFAPISVINELRKRFYEAIFYSEDFSNRKVFQYSFAKLGFNNEKSFAIISDDFDFDIPNITSDLIFAPKEYLLSEIKRFFALAKDSQAEKYLYLPPFLSDDELDKIQALTADFDGFYVDGAYGIKLKERFDKKIFLGIETNVFNSQNESEAFLSKADKLCYSKELFEKELPKGNGYVFCFGAIKMMSLIYCPFGKKCEKCSKNSYFTLTDYAERQFKVRRYTLFGNCRFEIFNSQPLKPRRSYNKSIIDLTAFSKETKKELLNFYFNNEPSNMRFTGGALTSKIE